MQRDDKDFISQILKHPLQDIEFRPLSREEIYDRQSAVQKTSLLDVEGGDLGLSAEEIVTFITEGQRYSED